MDDFQLQIGLHAQGPQAHDWTALVEGQQIQQRNGYLLYKGKTLLQQCRKQHILNILKVTTEL